MQITPDQILNRLQGFPVRAFGPGEVVLPAGSATGRMLVLREGAVEIRIEETRVAQIHEPGAIFGEMAFLLGRPHTADVVAIQPASFYLIEDPEAFLEAEPQVAIYVARRLAERLNAVNHLMVELRHREPADDTLHGLSKDTLARVTQALQTGLPKT